MEKLPNNERGYPTGNIKHSDLIHRQIAYSEIYLKYPRRYTKPFSTYVVHHIDGNKENFSPKNLYLCTKEQHNRIHKEQKRVRRKFKKAREIYAFLNSPQKRLKEQKEKIESIKKFKCLDCGRPINHRGCCFSCNVKRKKFREEKFEKEDKRKEEKKEKYKKNTKRKIIILSIITIILICIIAFNLLKSNSLGDSIKSTKVECKDVQIPYSEEVCGNVNLIHKLGKGQCIQYDNNLIRKDKPAKYSCTITNLDDIAGTFSVKIGFIIDGQELSDTQSEYIYPSSSHTFYTEEMAEMDNCVCYEEEIPTKQECETVTKYRTETICD